jgi:hypothetical protein
MDLTQAAEFVVVWCWDVAVHLVKHSCPEILNDVRELLKSMNGANLAAFKEMKPVIKFLLDTKTMG